jgi:hypothetical protein
MKMTSTEEQRQELIERLEKVNVEICRLRKIATALQVELAALKNGGSKLPASKLATLNSKPAVTYDQAQARLEALRARKSGN